METPEPRHARRSTTEPYIEEKTYYSKERDENGEPLRTYHARRIDDGNGWSYEVSMEVIAKQAAEDIIGRNSKPDENTRTLWDAIWKKNGV